MRTNEAFPSKYLKAADIGEVGVAERVMTVASVAVEDVGTDKKQVARFIGEKKALVLNRTNWDAMATIAGDDESDGWGGMKVALFTQNVTYNGRTGPAIRVRPARPTKSKAAAPLTPADEDDFEDEVAS
jgi:hypothetical protein